MLQSTRLASLLVLILLTSSVVAPGQAPSGTYPVWDSYDSTFHAGALGVLTPVIATRLLHFDFTHLYCTSVDKMKTEHADSSNRHGGDLYRRAGEEGLKISVVSPRALLVTFAARTAENFVGSGRGFHLGDFSNMNGVHKREFLTLDSVDQYGEVADSANPFRIVDQPRFTFESLEPGDTAVFSASGVTDSSRYVRLSMYISIDDADVVEFDVQPDDTVLAVTLIRPVVVDSCVCDFSERFDTLHFTYGEYDSATEAARGSHSGISRILDLDSLTPRPGKLVTRNAFIGADSVDPSCVTSCDSLRTLLDSLYPGRVTSTVAQQSDFYYDVWSAGVVPMQFYKVRIAKATYQAILRGEFNEYLGRVIDSIYAWPVYDTIAWRLGIADEAKPRYDFQPWGAISLVFDSVLTANNKDWQVWNNTYQDLQALRLMTGDLDSVNRKVVQMFSPQPYGSSTMPLKYANPDSIDADIYDAFCPNVAQNSMPGYEAYTEAQQESFGTFRERLDDSFRFGGMSGMARAVDEARFRHRHYALSHPVYNNVQVHGTVKRNDSTQTYTGWVDGKNPPPPEKIMAEAWMAMNCGSDGVIFSDFVFAGSTLGPLNRDWHVDVDSVGEYKIDEFLAQMTDYDSLYSSNLSNISGPKIWVGYRARFEAVRTVMDGLHTIDSIVGWRNLRFEQEQLSLHDTLQSIEEIPVLEAIRTRQAKRYDLDTLDQFVDSSAFDPRAESYLEITQFTPSAGDTTSEEGTRYLLLTNRRTWPIDFTCYEKDINDNCIDTGLGYIDVRKPAVILINRMSIIADSALVERVGSDWSRTVAYQDELELEWLEPGHGAMYRITPISRSVSEHGTAWNNAVHSENPSTDSTALDRLVVYERDSVVYMRSVDPDGAWSAEVMLSDPADTVLVNGKRTASNFFASLAIARDGSGSPRFVWERDSAGYRSVETGWIGGATPITRTTLDSILSGEFTIERHRLCLPDSLEGPPALTPSIVAVTDDLNVPGFLISWANHDEGIDLLAMHHLPDSASHLVARDTAGLYGLYATEYALKVGQYPTLATAMMRERVPVPPNDFISGPMPAPADTIGVNVERADLMLAHMAWQQGDGVDGADELIYYRRVGIDFPDDRTRPTLAAVDTTEHVSKNIPGCSFEHPSIAADSVQVGVAFESFGNIGASRVVTLRHRDTSGTDPATQAPYKAWETTYYRFGEVFGASPFNVGYATGENVRPSLTHFPELDSNSLLVLPEGGLVWFWQDNEEGRGHPQSIYRYGWFTRRLLEDGAHPSLTLVPLVAANPFEQSSVLHRGDSAERVVGTNDEGTSVWYYSGNLLNTPGNPLPALFNDPPSTGGIVAGISVFTKDPSLQAFCQPVHRGFEWGLGFDHPSTDHPDDDRHPPGDPGVITSSPGLPPTFFEPGLGGRTLIDTIEGSERISRTGLFAAGDESVDVIRYAAARDSVSLWLDTQPFDTQRGVTANIWSVVELVRASDSVVLWRGDTLTARGLDTTTSPINKILSVPVESWADSGEVVWIQVRGFATDGVDLSIAGGFTFFESFETQPSAKRGVGRDAKESGSSSSTLDLAVVPNPVTSDRAVLHVVNSGEGRITVTLWDNRGRLLRELPKIDGMRPGIYSVELDLEGLASGAYHLRAERGGEVTVESLTIP